MRIFKFKMARYQKTALQLLSGIFFFCTSVPLFAAAKTLNIYAWGAEIPISLIQQFQQKTGIHVNFSTYDSNETLYTKLRANKKTTYDIIFPSAYYVERLRNQNLLTKLDLNRIKNLKNLDPLFNQQAYDPGNQYSIPLVWGTTGIFYNRHWIKSQPTSWKDLWQPQWQNQLLMLDDIREGFSVALLSLGYKPDDTDPKHIEEAYQQLLRLVPNVKLFGSDAIRAIMIDEDVNIGMSWSGDAYKVQLENPMVEYVLPQDGFMIWLDCLAIPKKAPHLDEAYQFIDYMLEAANSAQITIQYGYAITNLAGQQVLPPALRENKVIFPSKERLKKGYFQRDVGESTVELYNHYWQLFKLAF